MKHDIVPTGWVGTAAQALHMQRAEVYILKHFLLPRLQFPEPLGLQW